MTSYVPQSDVDVVGVAFHLADGDMLSVGQAIDIRGTVGAARVTGDQAWISCHGSMVGGTYGVSLGGDENELYVGAAGLISGGGVGIDLLGHRAEIDNNGTIFGGWAGIYVTGYGPDGTPAGPATVRNSGTVSSQEKAIFVTGEREQVILENTGVIKTLAADGFSYFSQWIATDIVLNAGTMIGNVVLGRGDDIFLSSAGTVAGSIDGGAGKDTISATALQDIILGGTGDDSLDGLAGDDAITGGAGKDSLVGGIGADRFLFLDTDDSTAAAAGRDTIRDFDAFDGDKIDLSAIDANADLGRNQAFAFIGARAFSHHAGELRAAKSGSDIYIYGDTDGNGLADFAIYLKGVASLSVADLAL